MPAITLLPGVQLASTTDTNTYTTTTYTPTAAGNLVILAIVNSKASAPDEITSITGASLANVQKITSFACNTVASPTQRINIWCATATASAAAVVFNFGATQTGAVWHISEWGNVNTKVGINGVGRWVTNFNDTAGTAAFVTGVTPSDVHNGQYALYAAGSNVTATPKSGWTEGDDRSYITPAAAREDQLIATNDPLSTATLSGSTTYGAFICEVIGVDALPQTLVAPQVLARLGRMDLPVPIQVRSITAAPSAGITGTLATTNANDTSAAAGTTTVTGTLAKTNANDTSAAAGTTTVTGALARTNANDTLAASGSMGSPVSGTLARTNNNDTSSAAGTTTVTGTSATTNANDTLSASGVVGTPVVVTPTTQTVGGTFSGRRGPYTAVDAELEAILADDDEVLCLL